MTPFPLLKLPFLAQKIIIRQIDLYITDVIDLSMQNRKWKRLLDLVKFEVESVHFKFENNYFSFVINTRSGHFVTSVNIISSFSTIFGSKNQRIDGDLVPIFHMHRDFLVGKCEFDTDKSRLDLLEKYTRHFLGFMKVQKFSVECTTSLGVRNLFIWKYISRFEQISFGPDRIYMQPAQRVEMTSDDFVFLLENVSTDYLFLNTLISDDPRFKYLFPNPDPSKSGSSEIRKIKIINTNWIDFDNLLKMDVESVEAQVPRGCINNILKNWISGTNKKLEHLKLIYETSSEDVLEGVNSTPTNFTNEELIPRSGNVGVQIWGWLPDVIKKDIQRNHDGCLATVIFSNNIIEMLVWNEKHLKAIGRI